MISFNVQRIRQEVDRGVFFFFFLEGINLSNMDRSTVQSSKDIFQVSAPTDIPEKSSKSVAFQTLLAQSTVPTSISNKLNPTVPLLRLFDGVDARSFVRVRPTIESDDSIEPDLSVVQKVSGRRDAVMMLGKASVTGTNNLEPVAVGVDGTFVGGKDDNEVVYEAVVPPLLQYALSGGSTSVVCYGETGSGKTHTCFGLLRCLTKDLEPFMESHTIFLTVLEQQQTSAVDVLTGETVQVSESDSDLAFAGAATPEITQIAMMEKLLEAVEQQRNKHAKSTAKTHLVVRIQLRSKKATWAKPGIVNIVDLAGSQKASEHKHIGAAFMALKDCIRIKAMHRASSATNENTVPFRTTPITLLMKDSLEIANRATKLALICCISPTVGHMRQSFETLRFAALCCVANSKGDGPPPPMIPTFTFQDCCDFFNRVTCGRTFRFIQQILPEGFDGKRMLQMSEDDFVKLFSEAPPAPMRLPPRLGKSAFSSMQTIAIATKCLGPSSKKGDALGFSRRGLSVPNPKVQIPTPSSGREKSQPSTPAAPIVSPQKGSVKGSSFRQRESPPVKGCEVIEVKGGESAVALQPRTPTSSPSSRRHSSGWELSDSIQTASNSVSLKGCAAPSKWLVENDSAIVELLSTTPATESQFVTKSINSEKSAMSRSTPASSPSGVSLPPIGAAKS